MLLRRKNSRFTIMAAGAKGSGKSTFFNNLISRSIVQSRGQCEIDVYMVNLDSIGASQNVVFIDTPGFGLTLNDEKIQDYIVEYIKDQFDLFIEEEAKIRRNPNYEDTRVHCLLYFIPATSNGLKMRDISFLKKVSGLVNIIPVISKSDALSIKETTEFKSRVNDQLQTYQIECFDFNNPEYLPIINESISQTFGSSVDTPFTLICTDKLDDSNMTKAHVAGTIEILNPEYSNFPKLQNILLGTHTEMLIEVTVNGLYEKYRTLALENELKNKEPRF